MTLDEIVQQSSETTNEDQQILDSLKETMELLMKDRQYWIEVINLDLKPLTCVNSKSSFFLFQLLTYRYKDKTKFEINKEEVINDYYTKRHLHFSNHLFVLLGQYLYSLWKDKKLILTSRGHLPRDIFLKENCTSTQNRYNTFDIEDEELKTSVRVKSPTEFFSSRTFEYG